MQCVINITAVGLFDELFLTQQGFNVGSVEADDDIILNVSDGHSKLSGVFKHPALGIEIIGDIFFLK